MTPMQTPQLRRGKAKQNETTESLGSGVLLPSVGASFVVHNASDHAITVYSPALPKRGRLKRIWHWLIGYNPYKPLVTVEGGWSTTIRPGWRGWIVKSAKK